MLRRNVGGIDRVLRVTLGAIFFVAGLLLLGGKASVGLAVIVVGLLILLTGIVRFCVLYIPFGVSTAQTDKLRVMQPCDCCVEVKDISRKGGVASSAATSRDQADQAAMAGHNNQ